MTARGPDIADRFQAADLIVQRHRLAAAGVVRVGLDRRHARQEIGRAVEDEGEEALTRCGAHERRDAGVREVGQRIDRRVRIEFLPARHRPFEVDLRVGCEGVVCR